MLRITRVEKITRVIDGEIMEKNEYTKIQGVERLVKSGKNIQGVWVETIHPIAR